MKIDPPTRPSTPAWRRRARCSGSRNVLPGAITVVTPSSLEEVDSAVGEDRRRGVVATEPLLPVNFAGLGIQTGQHADVAHHIQLVADESGDGVNGAPRVSVHAMCVRVTSPCRRRGRRSASAVGTRWRCTRGRARRPGEARSRTRRGISTTRSRCLSSDRRRTRGMRRPRRADRARRRESRAASCRPGPPACGARSSIATSPCACRARRRTPRSGRRS